MKAEAKPVGRPVLQQLSGAAVSMRGLGICFALAGYTPQAIGWSQGADLALFSFDLQGVPVPVNERAAALMATATS